MTAEIISLAEARHLRQAEVTSTPERDEEPGSLNPELLHAMALIILGQTPGAGKKWVVTRQPIPGGEP